MQFKFFNPHGAARVTHNRLPHWQQDGALYFVTFHLADSIPAEVQARLQLDTEKWLARHPEPHSPETEHEYRTHILSKMEAALEEGHGSCALRAPECSEIVANAIRHFDGDRLDVMAFIVMPNHVHTAIIPREGWHLEQIIQSWKQWTAKRINTITAASGALWQTDYFDTILRDREHLGRVLRYIRNNPVKAHLRPREYALYESDYAIHFLGAGIS